MMVFKDGMRLAKFMLHGPAKPFTKSMIEDFCWRRQFITHAVASVLLLTAGINGALIGSWWPIWVLAFVQVSFTIFSGVVQRMRYNQAVKGLHELQGWFEMRNEQIKEAGPALLKAQAAAARKKRSPVIH